MNLIKRIFNKPKVVHRMAGTCYNDRGVPEKLLAQNDWKFETKGTL